MLAKYQQSIWLLLCCFISRSSNLGRFESEGGYLKLFCPRENFPRPACRFSCHIFHSPVLMNFHSLTLWFLPRFVSNNISKYCSELKRGCSAGQQIRQVIFLLRGKYLTNWPKITTSIASSCPEFSNAYVLNCI